MLTQMNEFKPEIAELLLRVEEEYGQSIRTTTDFEVFSLSLKEGISTATLKRLWGYVNDKHTPRYRTLDILSRYIGHVDFKGFCHFLQTNSGCNSSFFTTRQIQVQSLQPGAIVEIGWSPNRYLRLQYHGRAVFEVVESRQSKLLPGDRFETVSFLMGQPLSLAYVLRNNERTVPFIAGRNGGLTLINCVCDE